MASLIGAGVIFTSLLLSVRLGSRLRRSNQATVARFMAVIVASKGMLFTHNLGSPDSPNTSLPAKVFCEILTDIREEALGALR